MTRVKSSDEQAACRTPSAVGSAPEASRARTVLMSPRKAAWPRGERRVKMSGLDTVKRFVEVVRVGDSVSWRRAGDGGESTS